MIKIIYAEGRKPGCSREQFVRRWRIHGGYAMQDAHFWDPMIRYIQNDCVLDVSGFSGADLTYDGVGELFYPDQRACDRSLGSAKLDDIIADGDVFFARDDTIHAVVDVHELRNDRPGAFKIFLFVKRPEATDPSVCGTDWQQRLNAAISKPGSFSSLVRQVSIAYPVEPDASFDAVIDFSFDTLADARGGYADWVEQMAAEHAAPLLDPAQSVVIVTHSCLLYDTQHYGAD